MNMKRLIFAIIAGWVVIFGTDFLIHGFWLKPDYDATKAIWRPENEMQAHFCWMLFAQFLCAATFVIIWAKGSPEAASDAAPPLVCSWACFSKSGPSSITSSSPCPRNWP
jgi:hypothetical protein